MMSLILACSSTAAQEPIVTDLLWDPGLASDGTQVYTHTNAAAGDSYFRVLPQNTAVGAWRTALRVFSGEADMYLRQGGLETEPAAYPVGSSRIGSDGFVLHASEFDAAQEWHILVRATAGARWTLVTGEAYVQDLGPLSSSSSGSGPVAVGPEGIRYFKTTIPSDTLAWRLWLNGNPAALYVQKSAAPVPRINAFDLQQAGQMLVVPDYIDTATFDGSYFIGVEGEPGAMIELSSGQHAVADVPFNFTNAPITLTGFGYATYRVQVPVEQIAWQVDVVPVSGNPNLAVRREKVPNEYHNDAMSEVGGGVIDSLTLVPPTLSDGTFYITVYGTGPFEFRLQNGNPAIDPIHYVGSVLNTETNRVGWRFFTVSDINEQLGSLGWHLYLENAPPDTEIAIRRNAVPGRWNYRFMETPDYAIGGHVDASGVNFLQEPGHQADIWYVGVYNPRQPLDAFRLVTEHLTARPLDFAGGSFTNTSLVAPKVDYYAVSIPSGQVTWKVKVTALAEDVRLLVLKDQLPGNTAGGGNASVFSVPGRLLEKPGNEHMLLQARWFETQAQLPAGTYYLGVASDAANGSGYIIESSGSIPIASLGTVGTADLTRADTLEGGEVKAYRFEVPAGLPLVEVWLDNRTGNPAMALTPGASLPQTRGNFSLLGDYGCDGGTYSSSTHLQLITLANPAPGTYSLIVKAIADGWDYPDASYTIRLHSGSALAAGFDASRTAVASHLAGTWRFFRIDVPPDALGWDLRVIEPDAGDPLLFVRRDLLPVYGEIPGPDGGQWPSGAQWIVSSDWTGYSQNPDGSSRLYRTLAVGMGCPLEPGTYYVGILNGGSTDANYTLWSRGIGPSYAIPVETLPFAGGAYDVNALAAGEAAYFRVTVPSNAPSWKVKLTTASGETMLAAQKSCLPSMACSYEYSVLGLKGGKKMQKPGAEHFAMFPSPGETLLPPGDYFFAVVSEGQNPVPPAIGSGNVTARLESGGVLPVVGLGALSAADLTRADAVEGGEVKAFQFTVPAGTPSIEVRLEDRVGDPVFALRAGSSLPRAFDFWDLNDYGAEGGEPYQWIGTTGLPITVANPPPGTFSLIVKGTPFGPEWPDATCTIRVHRVEFAPLDFDGGIQQVTNQEATAWRFFRVEAPADCLGWDLRLTNVAGGRAQLYMRRDLLPDVLDAPGLNLNQTNWPSGFQYSVSKEWASYAAWPDGTLRYGQVFGVGMGYPLEPGTYYVGVHNGGETPASYSILSRGIGANRSIRVPTLAFAGGTAVQNTLGAGEAAYYRVDVPENAPSWKVRLEAVRGEVCLVAQKDLLPNVDCGAGSSVTTWSGGKLIEKSGTEHFTLLPAAGQSNLIAGAHYLAVISGGINPDGDKIGSDSSQCQLTSIGPLPVMDLGAAGAVDIVQAGALEGGDLQAYQFAVPEGALNVELRLEDQVGHPAMSLCAGDRLPIANAWSSYGAEGGDALTVNGDDLITLPNPAPGKYSLIVNALADAASQFSDATYTLRIRSQALPSLNFSETQNTNGLSHTASGTLADGQSAFYRVAVPADLGGTPIIGWQLDLAQTQGAPLVRARKDGLPADGAPDMTAFDSNMANIVAPLLAPGIWYVEVRGQGHTEYTLTSRPLALERPPWTMPAIGQAIATPGVTPPEFGDSGVDTAGQPIEPLPSDLGIDLAQGDYHYYAVQVPTNNAGLLRVQLQAISGNPDLYTRAGNPPTRSHGQIGWFTTGIYDRVLTGTETEYGNFVPIQGQLETELPPGLWYLAVQAAGDSNVRYRLKFSIGQVQPMDLDGGSFTNQVLAAGDWRYYRVEIPLAAPAQWRLTFSQQSGDVVMMIRDTVPPGISGNALVSSADVDWSNDRKNTGPYPRYDEPGVHTLTTPPVRPGATYYVGFKAVTDASFSVSSAASGSLDLQGAIAFYGGNASMQIPPLGQALYRVDVPDDGTRWRSFSTHADSVVLHIEQGTVPKPPATHYQSAGADSVLKQVLDRTTWPWQPGQSYFLLVTNTSDVAQPWAIALDGRNANTEDEDEDGLPDTWERFYFGDLSALPGDDPDDDDLSNLQEFQGNTNPTVSDAVTIRLSAPKSLPGGTFQFQVAGPAHRSYRIEATEDWIHWTTVRTVDAGAGDLLFTETMPAGSKRRFYRAACP